MDKDKWEIPIGLTCDAAIDLSISDQEEEEDGKSSNGTQLCDKDKASMKVKTPNNVHIEPQLSDDKNKALAQSRNNDQNAIQLTRGKPQDTDGEASATTIYKSSTNSTQNIILDASSGDTRTLLKRHPALFASYPCTRNIY